MKINKLDLAKTISDFMFLWIENPEEEAIKVYKLKHTLTAHGFEKYIQYYFEKYKHYKVKLNWKTHAFDEWIDLKGIKLKNWERHFLIVQCKKYSLKDITEDHIAHFYWKIIDKCSKFKDKTKIYYITTSKFTQKAHEFAKNKWINDVNFYGIYKLQKLFPLEQFKSELLIKEWTKEVWQSFEKQQLIMNLHTDIMNTIDATDKDVFQLLKQIRRDYSHYKQLRLWDIARNDTLELLAKKRPHNFEVLKQITNHLSTREKNKINKHWNIFIKRLQYIHNDDKIEKWFFRMLMNFIK